MAHTSPSEPPSSATDVLWWLRRCRRDDLPVDRVLDVVRSAAGVVPLGGRVGGSDGATPPLTPKGTLAFFNAPPEDPIDGESSQDQEEKRRWSLLISSCQLPASGGPEELRKTLETLHKAQDGTQPKSLSVDQVRAKFYAERRALFSVRIELLRVARQPQHPSAQAAEEIVDELLKEGLREALLDEVHGRQFYQPPRFAGVGTRERQALVAWELQFLEEEALLRELLLLTLVASNERVTLESAVKIAKAVHGWENRVFDDIFTASTLALPEAQAVARRVTQVGVLVALRMLHTTGYMENLEGGHQLQAMVKFVLPALSNASVARQILGIDVNESISWGVRDRHTREQILAQLGNDSLGMAFGSSDMLHSADNINPFECLNLIVKSAKKLFELQERLAGEYPVILATQEIFISVVRWFLAKEVQTLANPVVGDDPSVGSHAFVAMERIWFVGAAEFIIEVLSTHESWKFVSTSERCEVTERCFRLLHVLVLPRKYIHEQNEMIPAFDTALRETLSTDMSMLMKLLRSSCAALSSMESCVGNDVVRADGEGDKSNPDNEDTDGRFPLIKEDPTSKGDSLPFVTLLDRFFVSSEQLLEQSSDLFCALLTFLVQVWKGAIHNGLGVHLKIMAAFRAHSTFWLNVTRALKIHMPVESVEERGVLDMELAAATVQGRGDMGGPSSSSEAYIGRSSPYGYLARGLILQLVSSESALTSSRFSGDRTSFGMIQVLADVIKTCVDQHENQDEVLDYFVLLHLYDLVQLLVSMLHHQLCLVVRKTRDPKLSQTRQRLETSDADPNLKLGAEATLVLLGIIEKTERAVRESMRQIARDVELARLNTRGGDNRMSAPAAMPTTVPLIARLVVDFERKVETVTEGLHTSLFTAGLLLVRHLRKINNNRSPPSRAARMVDGDADMESATPSKSPLQVKMIAHCMNAISLCDAHSQPTMSTQALFQLSWSLFQEVLDSFGNTEAKPKLRMANLIQVNPFVRELEHDQQGIVFPSHRGHLDLRRPSLSRTRRCCTNIYRLALTDRDAILVVDGVRYVDEEQLVPLLEFAPPSDTRSMTSSPGLGHLCIAMEFMLDQLALDASEAKKKTNAVLTNAIDACALLFLKTYLLHVEQYELVKRDRSELNSFFRQFNARLSGDDSAASANVDSQLIQHISKIIAG
ncbi:hypothetical protein BBJ29_008230 [Phytophthora kernoviae]|uniref:Uncharacterized protein n=1 Tax=Phytophthora kernoviae TaxID=325452 RepID=A0A3F2REW1_9STRA|nr:hypothetical protein BBP00_00008656 [Phytophthora kernoviae]RLN58369.1 hypothetical protein BBJ29_008230 [Phytophthora kernoviae]